MKINPVVFLYLLSIWVTSCTRHQPIKVIPANSNRATIKVDGNVLTENWIISPEISLDVYSLEMTEDAPKEVTFLTDLDSVKYKLKLGDYIDFTVLLNPLDSARTRLAGVPGKVNFTKEYIRNHRGKSSVEILESQELFQIIAVITPTGLADTRSMIINHDSTDYYKSVLAHFLPFKEEPIVHEIDSLLQKNWYINLKADACALEFDDNNQLNKSKIYDRMRGAKNLLEPYLDQLNDFAQKSYFRSFFAQNKAYYQSLIEWHEREISTKEQWRWLEEQFPEHHYDQYRITFSPLVKGNHSTVRFDNNGFKQAVMFIRPPYQVKGVSDAVSNGLVTRLVFTEIDHNYVNPETDKYLEEVNAAFTDRDKWTDGKESKGYDTPYKIFNEYMTWSVYLLYCWDTYQEQDFGIINERIIFYMKNRRGFQQFGSFHNKLLNDYKQRKPNETVSDLYPKILDWAMNFDAN